MSKVKLEVTKDMRRLHIGSFFIDLNESEYQELVRTFSDQSRKAHVSDSLLAPSLDKRIAFAKELVQSINGDMPVIAILTTTYWMQAEMINLNKQ